MREVAVLCVAQKSPYKGMPGVETFDKRRNVRTFKGGMPVVAHPPCRAWSPFTSHQSKPAVGEAELGLLCADWLRREGGVLGHPAHSRLFEVAGLPPPGKRIGDLFTVPVLQAWWGYPMRKATWLCFSRVDPRCLDFPAAAENQSTGLFPFPHHDPRSGEGDRRRQQVMSRAQRAATCEPLAHWLVNAARAAQTRGKP